MIEKSYFRNYFQVFEELQPIRLRNQLHISFFIEEQLVVSKEHPAHQETNIHLALAWAFVLFLFVHA